LSSFLWLASAIDSRTKTSSSPSSSSNTSAGRSRLDEADWAKNLRLKRYYVHSSNVVLSNVILSNIVLSNVISSNDVVLSKHFILSNNVVSSNDIVLSKTLFCLTTFCLKLT
jgi:hypothetical protein